MTLTLGEDSVLVECERVHTEKQGDSWGMAPAVSHSVISPDVQYTRWFGLHQNTVQGTKDLYKIFK